MNKIQRRRLKWEARFMTPVYRALMVQVREVAASVEKYGVAYARFAKVNPEPVRKALEKLYKVVMIGEANAMYDGLKVKRASIGINEAWQKEVLAYLDKYLLNKAVLPISDYSKKIIEDAIKKGVEEGLGAAEIAKMLRGLEDVNKVRAMRIVRTEAGRAANFGHMLAANDSPYVYLKEWIAADDGRTRDTHRPRTGVDGEVVDFNQRFSNGLLYPGDPAGVASEVVNCRCTVAFRVKRDANGNPIRKPQQVFRRSLVETLWGITIGNILGGLINEIIGE